MSYAYGAAYEAKLTAEATKAAETVGSHIKSGIVTYYHKDRPRVLAVLSSKIGTIYFRGAGDKDPFDNNIIPEYPRLVYDSACVSKALDGFIHMCGIYLYWPASLTYWDLLTFKSSTTDGEGGWFKELAEYLYQHNIDYKITYNPESINYYPSLIIYSAEYPILNDKEIENVSNYVNNGGFLIYACPRLPLKPDASKSDFDAWRSQVYQPGNVHRGNVSEFFNIDDWHKVVCIIGLGKRFDEGVVSPTDQSWANLLSFATSKDIQMNPRPGGRRSLNTRKGLNRSSYLFWKLSFFTIEQKLLLVNNDKNNQANIKIELELEDHFTGQVFQTNELITIKPELFRLFTVL